MPKSETVTCECGITVTKDKLKRHRETKRHADFLADPELFKKFIETRDTPVEELKKKYQKTYYLKHQDALIEKRNENKDAINAKRRETYAKNKETINESRKEIIKCECGFNVCKTGLARHLKTNKHLVAIQTIKNVVKDTLSA